MRTEARNSAPVLSACKCAREATSSSRPVASMSSAWPAHMPSTPLAAASSRSSETRIGAGSADSASTEKASACRASPARMAVASSQATCTVGRPRRKASSSIAGRSSCTSEKAWISSTAVAGASSASASPPKACPAAYTSKGRRRLPPPSAAWRIAASRCSGRSAGARERSSAASVRARQEAISASVDIAREVFRALRVGRVGEHAHALLGAFQRLPAIAIEGNATLVGGKRFVEALIALFHLLHDLLELVERALEAGDAGRRIGGNAGHGEILRVRRRGVNRAVSGLPAQNQSARFGGALPALRKHGIAGREQLVVGRMQQGHAPAQPRRQPGLEQAILERVRMAAPRQADALAALARADAQRSQSVG